MIMLLIIIIRLAVCLLVEGRRRYLLKNEKGKKGFEEFNNKLRTIFIEEISENTL